MPPNTPSPLIITRSTPLKLGLYSTFGLEQHSPAFRLYDCKGGFQNLN